MDLSVEGGLVNALRDLTPEWMKQHGAGARRRAEEMFSKDAVITQYIEYYKKVIQA